MMRDGGGWWWPVWPVLVWLMMVPCVRSQCLPGLAVYEWNRNLLLGDTACNQILDSASFSQPPVFLYNRARPNDTYLLMMLQAVDRNPDLYILHWLVSEVKSSGVNLQTVPGGRDLTAGYLSPTNQTRYEFRLYNTTGNVIWETITSRERYDFSPLQWLIKNKVYSEPLAKTIFNIRRYPPGPVGGWAASYPPGQVPVQPAPYPSQPTPPVGYQPQQPYPQPILPHPQPPPPAVLPHPQPPPPAVLPHPQPPPPAVIPHPQPAAPPSTSLHTAAKYHFINGTRFSVHQSGQPLYNPLNINSTIYTADFYNRSFRLSPYLIIDNVSYIKREIVHAPGKGFSYFINGTHYVPFIPPKEVHHHHYHKGSATTVTPTLLFIISLLPFLAVSYT